MRKRVLSFFMAATAAFCSIFVSSPEAQAIVPVGLVQSALASYVASTGYNIYTSNNIGSDLLSGLSQLYDDFRDFMSDLSEYVPSLDELSSGLQIRLDSNNNFVFDRDAAQTFQGFSAWLQSHYDIPLDGTQVDVIQSSDYTVINHTYPSGFYADWFGDGPLYINDQISVIGWSRPTSSIPSYVSNEAYYTLSGNFLTDYCCAVFDAVGNYGSTAVPVIVSRYPGSVIVNNIGYDRDGNITSNTTSTIDLLLLPSGAANNSAGIDLYYFYQNWSYSNSAYANRVPYPLNYTTLYYPVPNANYLQLVSDFWMYVDSGVSSGVIGLALSLSDAVVDLVSSLNADDVLIIDVGASASDTPAVITDIVTDGIIAQTLDPVVSVVPEAVVDTPVQVYPDVDDLGLPQLGAALVSRFPFCIPWDFVDTVRLLSADPQPINIKVDLIPQRIKTFVGISLDTSFDIDLSGEQYAKIGLFCRWGSLVTFCFGLFLLTKRLVWTA